jgi:trehalose 6-phosphate synthase/phosphatase
MKKNNLIIVSNRLPIVVDKTGNDGWLIQSGTGGLVTALAPVLRNRGGIWIGWSGYAGPDDDRLNERIKGKSREVGYDLISINLSPEEKEKYYRGFANEVLWPLFHDFISYCNFDPEYWSAYQKVCEKFARITAQSVNEGDLIWIHDYHLIGVVPILRALNIKNMIAFFLHIPFPPPDVYVHLPWRFEILNFLLQYDIIGFQTARDRLNFYQCIRMFMGDLRGMGKSQVSNLAYQDREIRIGTFPVSIDFKAFAGMAASEQVRQKAKAIRENYPNQKIVLGIDRMDYTKGIPERLKAFRNALRKFPELRGKLTLIQFVVPSRRKIDRYESLKSEIEGLVGEISGEFTQTDWVPIHYFFKSLDRADLVAYYLASDIALVTSLKDGMNLIAKEYCASQINNDGILILSEFAGAAGQLKKGALLTNPHDFDGTAEALLRAFEMPEEFRKEQMSRLRENVRRYDIFWWVNSYLEAAFAKNLNNFPVMEDYVPLAVDGNGNSRGIALK